MQARPVGDTKVGKEEKARPGAAAASRSVAAGLRRCARGVYMLPGQPISEHDSLALAVKQALKAKVCLLSALRFHDLATQAPYEVWLAMAHNAVLPRISTPSIRLFRFSGRALEEGVEHHEIDGVDVGVCSAAKTVADCLKFRNTSPAAVQGGNVRRPIADSANVAVSLQRRVGSFAALPDTFPGAVLPSRPPSRIPAHRHDHHGTQEKEHH